MKAQTRVRMRPLGDPHLKRGRYVVENGLVAVEKTLISLLHLRAQRLDLFVEIGL